MPDFPTKKRKMEVNFGRLGEIFGVCSETGNFLLTAEEISYIIVKRAAEPGKSRAAHTAMNREIAGKLGNFRGVCPIIGRLRGNLYVA